MARWLIIPVEVKHREFLSRILLSAMAANRGYRVLLGKDTMIRRLAPALPRGVIFDKSLGTARHGKPQRFKKLGHKIVVLDEESTGFYGSPKQFLSVRLARETLAACERWYCISETLQDAATEIYPEYSERFLTTGLIRTDIWRNAYHHFYTAERDQIREAHGPFILFNSNFGGIIHARGDAFVNKQIRGQKFAYSDVQEKSKRIFAEGRRNLDAFLEVFPKILEQFPRHRLVIRPHPSEDISFWHNHFGSNDRILVSNESVATPWILASEILLHHGCTTGIEASILGKPHVMYAPHPDSHHDTEVMKTFTPIVKSETDLLQHIEAQLTGNLSTLALPSGAELWFANLQGHLVSEAILNDIDELSFETNQEITNSLPLDVRLRIWLAGKKKRSERELNYAKQKWPGTSVQEIQKSLQIAASGLGIDDGFYVDEVYPEVFKVSR